MCNCVTAPAALWRWVARCGHGSRIAHTPTRCASRSSRRLYGAPLSGEPDVDGELQQLRGSIGVHGDFGRPPVFTGRLNGDNFGAHISGGPQTPISGGGSVFGPLGGGVQGVGRLDYHPVAGPTVGVGLSGGGRDAPWHLNINHNPRTGPSLTGGITVPFLLAAVQRSRGPPPPPYTPRACSDTCFCRMPHARVGNPDVVPSLHAAPPSCGGCPPRCTPLRPQPIFGFPWGSLPHLAKDPTGNIW